MNPSRLVRLGVRLFALAAGGWLTGCFAPSDHDRAALDAMRFEYAASTRDSAQRFEVSAIRNGDADSPRVVFVHGTPGDAENFASFVLKPIEGAECVSIDRPGFGRTVPREAVPSLAHQAAAVAPLLVERAGVKPVVVGHSLGGPIALRLAADYPDKVGAVVVLAGSVDPSQEHVLFVQRLGEQLPALVPRVLRNANRELLPLGSELRDLESALSRVRCPVVIVHGSEDSLVPYDNAAWLRDHLPDAARVWTTTIPGEDHFFVWTEPDEVRRAVLLGLRAARGENPAD